jgi:hypothetical protein
MLRHMLVCKPDESWNVISGLWTGDQKRGTGCNAGHRRRGTMPSFRRLQVPLQAWHHGFITLTDYKYSYNIEMILGERPNTIREPAHAIRRTRKLYICLWHGILLSRRAGSVLLASYAHLWK